MPFMHFRNRFLCFTIGALVLKFEEPVIGLHYPSRSHGQVTRGAKRAFNVAAQSCYEIYKSGLVFVRGTQREPFRVLI